MPTVRAIHVSPVKSLRLTTLEQAEVTPTGLRGDRRLMLVDDSGRVADARRFGALLQLEARLDGDTLELHMPDGSTIQDELALQGSDTVEFYGNSIQGRWVNGPVGPAVSELIGREVRLFRGDAECACLDAHPVSMLSASAVDQLARQGGHDGDLDGRRFRPSLLLDGCEPHAEDAWIGRRVQAGEAMLDVVKLDIRCALTTRNPLTGERDADTLRWIGEFRPRDDGEICFGVYADVAQPGTIRIGDAVHPVES
ncbi:MAG: MOSC domain-containing protein [Gaiellales bacterium]